MIRTRAWLRYIVFTIICAVGLYAFPGSTEIDAQVFAINIGIDRLENGMISVRWQTNQAGWYALTWREEEDGVHWYLERPLLRTTIFNFGNKSYRSSGDILLSQEDALGTGGLYFGLGEDALLLWREGEAVDLPAATPAEEELWAPAMEPPQE